MRLRGGVFLRRTGCADRRARARLLPASNALGEQRRFDGSRLPGRASREPRPATGTTPPRKPGRNSFGPPPLLPVQVGCSELSLREASVLGRVRKQSKQCVHAVRENRPMSLNERHIGRTGSGNRRRRSLVGPRPTGPGTRNAPDYFVVLADQRPDGLGTLPSARGYRVRVWFSPRCRACSLESS